MNENYELLERFLDSLINPDDCIDTFGRTYLDDLDIIARENHGFNTEMQHFQNAVIQSAFEQIQKQYGFNNLSDLKNFVQGHRGEIAIANYRPRSALNPEEDFSTEPAYRALKATGDNIEASNEFQKNWSERGLETEPENNTDRDHYELYIGDDRMNPWTYLLKKELARGNLSAGDSVMCIGNRWNGEIYYFRETIGLKNAMGVDLISRDPELVVEADMHKMPFEDSSIRLIFCRGTLNKSYDIRVFIDEMLRVLQKDGFLALETPGPFGDGVNYLGRTDLKNSDNLLRLLKEVTKRIIYKDDAELIHPQGNVKKALRIFVQVDKSGVKALPRPEPFPLLRFMIYARYRNYLNRIRLKIRRKFRGAGASQNNAPIDSN